eukprot:CAMPEP_0113281036 /NCGR_PEP_ID=MMETSP0008_2-20120614/28074_1 /TAXON_ID=97485 /ORGANISM="Prymnesium parvum" /LENGTH=74 /DNA_ID=CAMNT_0000131401 /DNA_START=294 /DNA_END=518 /DNA_ORIENTATION=- /assembly_acc=CAM_ASM_000153
MVIDHDMKHLELRVEIKDLRPFAGSEWHCVQKIIKAVTSEKGNFCERRACKASFRSSSRNQRTTNSLNGLKVGA